MASVTEQVTEKVAEKAQEVKDGVKESLLGVELTDDQLQLPEQTRAEFMRHALKDEESGEYYMGEKEFVDAIAPMNEDYVRIALSLALALPCIPHCTCTSVARCFQYCRVKVRLRQQRHSTRSSATNTTSSFKSPTAATRIESTCRTGASSMACS